jgi:hypothetical protein
MASDDKENAAPGGSVRNWPDEDPAIDATLPLKSYPSHCSAARRLRGPVGVADAWLITRPA